MILCFAHSGVSRAALKISVAHSTNLSKGKRKWEVEEYLSRLAARQKGVEQYRQNFQEPFSNFSVYGNMIMWAFWNGLDAKFSCFSCTLRILSLLYEIGHLSSDLPELLFYYKNRLIKISYCLLKACSVPSVVQKVFTYKASFNPQNQPSSFGHSHTENQHQ